MVGGRGRPGRRLLAAAGAGTRFCCAGELGLAVRAGLFLGDVQVSSHLQAKLTRLNERDLIDSKLAIELSYRCHLVLEGPQT